MADKDYEKKIRKQLSDLFNKGFDDFAEFRDNRPVYEAFIKNHLDTTKDLILLNADMELLCKNIGLNFEDVIEEEYRKALKKISSSSLG